MIILDLGFIHRKATDKSCPVPSQNVLYIERERDSSTWHRDYANRSASNFQLSTGNFFGNLEKKKSKLALGMGPIVGPVVCTEKGLYILANFKIHSDLKSI
jgi:hypothetical protein